MEASDQQTVQSILQELLDKLGVKAEIETRFLEGVVVFNVRSLDSGILIGQRGAHLRALQYLTRVLSQKHLTEPQHIVVDVEDYKKSREEFLRELAKQAAERVLTTKEALLLKPMMAYERRVVHAEIAEIPEVTTESQGEDPERRVLIKPEGFDN